MFIVFTFGADRIISPRLISRIDWNDSSFLFLTNKETNDDEEAVDEEEEADEDQDVDEEEEDEGRCI